MVGRMGQVIASLTIHTAESQCHLVVSRYAIAAHFLKQISYKAAMRHKASVLEVTAGPFCS